MNLVNLAACSSGDYAFAADRPCIDVFAVDADSGDILHLRYAAGAWFRTIHANPFAPGRLKGYIAACGQTTSRVDVFGVDKSGSLQHFFLTSINPSVWATENLGAIGIDSWLTALWWNYNQSVRVDVLGTSADFRTLVQAAIVTYASPWPAWAIYNLDYTGFSGNPPLLAGATASCSDGSQKLEIYGTSQGGGLERIWWEMFPGWQGQVLPQGAALVAGQPVAACSRAPWLIDMFALDAQGNLLDVYFGDGWNSRTLPMPAVPNPTSWTLHAACARGADLVDLFFLNPASEILHVTVSNFAGPLQTGWEIINGAVMTEVPVPGNAFVTVAGPDDPRVSIDDVDMEAGKISHWTDPATVISLYFHVGTATTLSLGLRAQVATAAEPCTLSLTVNGQAFQVRIDSSTYTDHLAIGTVTVPAGYVQVDMRGVVRDGATFADVSTLLLSSDALVKIACVNFRTLPPGAWKNPNPKAPDVLYYNFGRRGPSVYLNFPPIAGEEAEYFYSEVTVPVEHDVDDGYYTAPDFAHGYLGFQRPQMPNKFDTPRVLLFSVWNNDAVTPKQPAQVIAIGPNVRIDGFGDEGSGARAFMPFAWVAGQTYRFILRGRPDGADSLYTAWYHDGTQWQPIATIRRPMEQEDRYLSGLSHFLENFQSTLGWVTRRTSYGNQYVYTHSGRWVPMLTATFDGDFFATQGQRRDFAGFTDPADATRMVLTNCGFIDGQVALKSTVTRAPTPGGMTLDVSALPEPTPLPPPSP